MNKTKIVSAIEATYVLPGNLPFSSYCEGFVQSVEWYLIHKKRGAQEQQDNQDMVEPLCVIDYSKGATIDDIEKQMISQKESLIASK